MTATKTILVTGANSGIGLETARTLATQPQWNRIVLGARSVQKADAARESIVQSTGRPASHFSSLVADLTDPASIDAALRSVDGRDLRFDALVLNAGGMAAGSADGMPKTDSGLTRMFAMNVGGHMRLVHGLLDADRILPGATIIFAGSEASRGIPMMLAKAPALPEGYVDIDAALAAVVRGEHVQDGGDDMVEYALVKLIGIAWMRALAGQDGHQLRALSVSPGMTAGTNIAAGMPAAMRSLMNWVGMPLMKLLGSAHDVQSGVDRYLRGLEDQRLDNGAFYASPGTGLTGELTRQSADAQPLLEDDAFARAVGRLAEQVATRPIENAA